MHCLKVHNSLEKARNETKQCKFAKSCPFCLEDQTWTEAKYALHVGRHQREISQAAIPLGLVAQDDAFENTSDEDGTGWNSENEETTLAALVLEQTSISLSSGVRDDKYNSSDSSKEKADPKKDNLSSPVSFIVRISELTPDFRSGGVQHTAHKMWDPPRAHKHMQSSLHGLYRWSDGLMEKVSLLSLADERRQLRLHNQASVFFQAESDHLLTTDINAATHDVVQWSRLFFCHDRVSQGSSGHYTSLDFAGCQLLTAAPMPLHISPQLLPGIYDNISTRKENAGIIGELSLLIALAALSAPRKNLDEVFRSSLRPGEWRDHSFPTGRTEHRGVIVCICYDPFNPEGSTEESLRAIERGDQGPFYN